MIAVVDIRTLLKDFIDKTASESTGFDDKPTDAQIQAIAAQFAHTLEAVIDKVAKENNAIVFPYEAVVSGAQDLTQAVKEKLYGENP